MYKKYKGRSILTWGKAYLKPECFPHLFPKWAYPSMRLQENNIVLVSNVEEHELVDKIFKRMRDEIGKRELLDRIKRWEDLSEDIRKEFLSLS